MKKVASLRVIFGFSLFLSSAPLLAASDFSGQVVAVFDGDTIEVLRDNRTERIRLQGIDCPEKGQAFGKKAKQATSELLFGKEVMLQTHGKDKQGRTIADVLLSDGTNVNQILVKRWLVLVVPEVRFHGPCVTTIGA